jgi:hypothetical protein
MRTPEGKVKERIKKLLNECNIYYVMPVTSGYGNSGAPDFLICMKGTFVGVECKAGKNRMTKLQELNSEKILDSGGLFFLVTEATFDRFAALITNIYGENYGRSNTSSTSDSGATQAESKENEADSGA